MVCRLQHPHAQNQVGEFSEEVALQISLRGAGVIIGVSIDVGPNGEIVAEVAQCEWARHENDEYFTPQEFVNAIKTGEVDALHCFCAKSPSLVGLPIDTLKAATKARVGRSRSGGYFASCHIYDHKAEQCHFYVDLLEVYYALNPAAEPAEPLTPAQALAQAQAEGAQPAAEPPIPAVNFDAVPAPAPAPAAAPVVAPEPNWTPMQTPADNRHVVVPTSVTSTSSAAVSAVLVPETPTPPSRRLTKKKSGRSLKKTTGPSYLLKSVAALAVESDNEEPKGPGPSLSKLPTPFKEVIVIEDDTPKSKSKAGRAAQSVPPPYRPATTTPRDEANPIVINDTDTDDDEEVNLITQDTDRTPALTTYALVPDSVHRKRAHQATKSVSSVLSVSASRASRRARIEAEDEDASDSSVPGLLSSEASTSHLAMDGMSAMESVLITTLMRPLLPGDIEWLGFNHESGFSAELFESLVVDCPQCSRMVQKVWLAPHMRSIHCGANITASVVKGKGKDKGKGKAKYQE